MTMSKIEQRANIKRKKPALFKLSKLKHVKIAISMPGEDLSRIEKTCRQLNLSRSKFMLMAVHHWFEAPKKQSLIEQYIRGYEIVPEGTAASRALEVIQSKVLDKESW